MKIFVLVRGGIDTGERISLSNGELDIEKLMFITNPFDEFAIEAALQLKEKFGGEVTAISVGNKHAEQALRNAIAMGVDHAILVQRDDYFWLGAQATAKHLADVLKDREPDLILAGTISTDMQRGAVPAYLSRLLELPFVPSIVGLEISDSKAIVTREEDWGQTRYEVKLPAVLGCDKGLNQPRLPSFRGVMKAKRAKIEIVTPETLYESETHVTGLEMATRSRKKLVFDDFDEFYNALKEGGVL